MLNKLMYITHETKHEVIMLSFNKREYAEPSRKICKQCNKTKSIHLFYKKLSGGTRRDICMDCFDDKNQITTRRRIKMTVARKIAETKYVVNAAEIFKQLEKTEELVQFIRAAKLGKETLIKLLLGIENRGAVKVVNTIASGGSLMLKKTGVEIEVPANVALLEAAYNKLVAPKVPGLVNKSFKEIGEMVEAGMSKELIIKFGKYNASTVEKYFASK